MIYNFTPNKFTIRDIVCLFEMNSKNKICIVNIDSAKLIYKGRIDYLQYSNDGEMDNLCKLLVYCLEVSNELTIYVEGGVD
mgnify:CR=1 FL=1